MSLFNKEQNHTAIIYLHKKLGIQNSDIVPKMEGNNGNFKLQLDKKFTCQLTKLSTNQVLSHSKSLSRLQWGWLG